MLSIRDLAVEFTTDAGTLRAVDGVSLTLAPGRKLGIVGESGCGKSTLSLAVMGLLEQDQYAGGSIEFSGENLRKASERRMREIRGAAISMIFQDASSALHPMLPVGIQIAEVLQAHTRLSGRDARARMIELLASVGIHSPHVVAKAYPHELSGGMCQRVMIAGAIACNPELIIADEPTTALDVTVQAQILDLLTGIAAERGSSILLITHDLGVVAGLADEVAVMYAGRIVERGETKALFRDPLHPYTRGLLEAVPQLGEGIGADLPTIPGNVGSSHTATGCRFAPRCGYAVDICRQSAPPLDEVREGHFAACWFTAELPPWDRPSGETTQ
jgi:oligopeptide/dipeptide ABC transporter ATP-binding protein